MSSGILQFQPQLLPTLLAMGLIPLFVALGFWQLDRAAEKRLLAEILESRIHMQPTALSELNQQPDEIQHRMVKARGRLLEERTIYIENRKHQGRNGFHVVSPLHVENDGRHLLVNRGWIAAQEKSAPPGMAAAAAELTVSGRADIPSAPALELQFQVDGAERVWPYLTLERYAAWSGLELFPFILLQTDEDDSGLVRQWPRPATEDGMHIGYAVQWFAFAAIVFAIWARLSLVRRQVGRVA